MEEALHECGPLQGEGGDQEVESHAAETVALQEGHEEAKANKDHHVHILETCREKHNNKISSHFGARNTNGIENLIMYLIPNVEFHQVVFDDYYHC